MVSRKTSLRHGGFCVWELPGTPCYILPQMKTKRPITISKLGQDNGVIVETPVMIGEAELTPKAEAKVANKLPRSEQLEKFELDLEAHDGGNQPA